MGSGEPGIGVLLGAGLRSEGLEPGEGDGDEEEKDSKNKPDQE